VSSVVAYPDRAAAITSVCWAAVRHGSALEGCCCCWEGCEAGLGVVDLSGLAGTEARHTTHCTRVTHTSTRMPRHTHTHALSH